MDENERRKKKIEDAVSHPDTVVRTPDWRRQPEPRLSGLHACRGCGFRFEDAQSLEDHEPYCPGRD